MKSETIVEVVKRLIGGIDPIGETNTDNKRFENLKVMTEVVDVLLTDIGWVAENNKDRGEYSRKRAGDFANKFYTKLGIVE